MNETLLAGLYLPFSERVRATLIGAEKMGLPLVDIFMGLRTFEEQDRLYTLGRTVKNPDGFDPTKKPLGNMVTKAPGGSSWHNYGLAADLVFCPKGPGRWSWDSGLPWRELGAVGVSCGLEWGGIWQFKDEPHFQMIGKLTIAKAKTIFVSAGRGNGEGLKAVWAKV